MKLFEGKSPSERNKIIAALVLGVLSVLAIGNMIFSPFSSRKTTVNIKLSPTPTVSPTRTGDTVVTALPNQTEINDIYTRIPVVMQYPPGASDAGRNIFAFYEPPIPTPYVPPPPTLPKTPKPETPVPVPTPNLIISSLNRQSAVAGDKGFKLEVGGSNFTPEIVIFFGGTPLPTNYVSAQLLTADIPANYIAAGGNRNIEVRSPDGKLFSNQVAFNVQQPPAPQFQYLGIVARKSGNNDTAYILEQGKTVPTLARLGDPIGGRFRLISISAARLLVQDINYSFIPPYSIEIAKTNGQNSTTTNLYPNQPYPNQNIYPQNQNVYPQQPNQPIQCPPGIPCNNVRPYIPPTPPPKNDDVDDDDGDN